MGILGIALTAALNILLQVILNPLFVLLVLVYGVFFLLAKLKVPFAVNVLDTFDNILSNALRDFQGDPVAFVILAFICSVNVTIGIIAVAAYFVARKINLKL